MGTLTLDQDARTAQIGEHELSEGDVVTIDGASGDVIVGAVELVPPQINEDFGTILEWADELRRLKVRTNADTPERRRQGARVRRARASASAAPSTCSRTRSGSP